MQSYYLQTESGKKTVSRSKLIVCSIVRDCSKNLEKNLKVLDALCKSALDYNVIIFENDSVDNTKIVLEKWSKKDKKIHVLLNDFNTVTIPTKRKGNVNPFFSEKRINKMAQYRNEYMNFIRINKIVADFIIVVDLDVANIDLKGIYHSFGSEVAWDAITANGYSISPKFKLRYHDTYALEEFPNTNNPQTEVSINEAQAKFSGLKKGDPMIKVYSAFGGLAIYKYEAISCFEYKVIKNNDINVEVRCEHFSLHKQMNDFGYENIYINPSMLIKYQNISLKIVIRKIKNFIINKVIVKLLNVVS